MEKKEEELLNLICWGQDCRYKYKNKAVKPYILFIKNKNHPRKIFYCRYADGIQISTRCTDLRKANQFALEHLESHSAATIQKQLNNDEFHPFIENYYKEGSKHIQYCNEHNRHIADCERKKMENVMNRISKMLPHIRKFNELNRRELINLREQLLTNGSEKGTPLSSKTVTSYFIHFERCYKELLDKQIIDVNPFDNLPPLKIEVTKRWDGFPITPLKHKLPIVPVRIKNNKDSLFTYSLISFLAIMTGTRKEELKAITSKDLFYNQKNGQTWLQVNGTKTKNSVRTIPVTLLTYYSLETYCLLKESGLLNHLVQNKEYDKQLLMVVGKECGYNSVDELKNGENKCCIVYHGFRKMYRSIFSQQNVLVNNDLIEYFMGHSSKTSIGRATNINDVYLLLDKVDNTQYHKDVVDCLAYFEPTGKELEDTKQFFIDFNTELKLEIEQGNNPIELEKSAMYNRRKCDNFIDNLITKVINK